MNEQERREAVRRAYDYRCGYCGVREEEAGSRLEIDHFRPRSVGGGDELDNLVYCCPTCNRIKGDFWPKDDSSATYRRLLYPKRDDVAQHLCEEENGRLIALTEIGSFHIERLRLNRPPLVTLRRARREVIGLHRDLAIAREERTRLQEEIAALEKDLEQVLGQLSRLSGL